MTISSLVGNEQAFGGSNRADARTAVFFYWFSERLGKPRKTHNFRRFAAIWLEIPSLSPIQQPIRLGKFSLKAKIKTLTYSTLRANGNIGSQCFYVSPDGVFRKSPNIENFLANRAKIKIPNPGSSYYMGQK